MKKLKRVNKKMLLVTVDGGKETQMGYYRCPDGNDVKPFKFSNNRRGFNFFYETIVKAKDKHNLEEIVVGFESTGSYMEPLTHYLKTKEIKIVQVNPMHTKRLKELEGNSPNKTDKKDPKVIADIMQLGHSLSVIVPEGEIAELRRLTHARERAITRRTAYLNQLQDLIFIIFPEFLQVMNGVKIKTAMYLLKHHPLPKDIVELGYEDLKSIIKKVSRGKLGEKRARELYDAAITTVGIKEGAKSIFFEIKNILEQVDRSEQYIIDLENMMSEYLEKVSYSGVMLSIKGLGKITVAGLIGEVGDFKNFKTLSEIEKLAGLDLYEISSGKHKGQRRISKRGRSLMRKILFFAAINMVRKDGIMHTVYHDYLDRGMIKMKALIAICRKILRIIFALVRDNKEYNKNYNVKDPALRAA